MKELRLNKNYKVVVDSDNYMVQERRVVKDEKSDNFGQERWLTISYHARIEQLFDFVCDKVIRDNWGDIDKIISEVRAIRQIVLDFKKLQ